MFVKVKKIYKFNVNNKNVKFVKKKLCLNSKSNNCDYAKVEEVSLKGNIYGFSVDYDAIEKYDILNIHKYLMFTSNIKYCSGLWNKRLLDYYVLSDL